MVFLSQNLANFYNMNDKKNKANLYCYIAETYINRFSKGANKNLLLDSIDLYFQAIRLDNECVEAYIGLSYLEYNYGNKENAWKMINKARSIEPLNIRVNHIRENFKKQFFS